MPETVDERSLAAIELEAMRLIQERAHLAFEGPLQSGIRDAAVAKQVALDHLRGAQALDGAVERQGRLVEEGGQHHQRDHDARSHERQRGERGGHRGPHAHRLAAVGPLASVHGGSIPLKR
ncbi:MAG: hypothetical protein QM765_35650 [Myxococcales bacterium]